MGIRWSYYGHRQKLQNLGKLSLRPLSFNKHSESHSKVFSKTFGYHKNHYPFQPHLLCQPESECFIGWVNYQTHEAEDKSEK